MTPLQQRVVEEKADLDRRRANLGYFLGTYQFADLAPDERRLLRRQHCLMCSLSVVLGDRIAVFEKSTGGPQGEVGND
mgnify:CR=1 FL=1|tara:strand:+ start:3920 stop:4153 length:234 start_codon:yes stop_codon:yes gene_type:complete